MDYLLMQERINYYSCYTKRLMNGFCEELQTNKIHFKRLTSIIERLLVNEDILFLNFLEDEKQSASYKILEYLNAQGEILSVGKGYYSLPPERSIVLPDNQSVVISSLKMNSDKVGIGRLTETQEAISLKYNQYVYLPSFQQVIQYFIQQLTDHHDVEPIEIIQFTERGSFKLNNLKQLKDKEYYILVFERRIGSQIKRERYFAQWKEKKWFVAEIKNGLLLRTTMALRSRKGVYSTYYFSAHPLGFIEVNLQYSLPKEEDVLMRLIATPKENKWTKKYLTTENQIENIRVILSHCELKEVKDHAIYN